MKNKLFLFTLVIFNIAFNQTQVRTIDVNGQSRSYRLYVPPIYDGLDYVPLVFNFHGYTSNAIEQEFYGNFKPIADTANFILVMPEGLDIGAGTGWNSFANTDESNYDYQFVNSMIDELSNEFLIDSTRIYSTGMSNGGFLSYDLACFLSHKFAAIASVTGGMISTHANICNPARPIPVMQIHGTLDPTVSYSGTGGIVSCLAVETLVSQWVQRNACATTPIETNVPNVNLSDNTTAIHFEYYGSETNSAVEFYKINFGGHTWPGADFPILGQNTNQDFDASTEIWRFFSKYRLNSESLNTKESKMDELSVYPNPTKNILNIEGIAIENNEIFLISAEGKIIDSIKTYGKSKLTFQIELLKSGIYFIKIGDIMKKIIIENY